MSGIENENSDPFLCRVFLIILLSFRNSFGLPTVKLRVSFPPLLWKGSFRGFKPISLFVWGGGFQAGITKLKVR